MKSKVILTFFLALLVQFSCDNDDGGPGKKVPVRSLIDVAIEDDDEFQEYFKTHFYNYEEFKNPPAGFDFKIVIDTISGDNSDKTPLINFVKSQVIKVKSSTFGRTDDEEVNHTLYYLEARKGGDGSKSPTIADNTVLRYQGELLNGFLFDASTTPTSQYLPSTLSGYANGVEKFSIGSLPTENGDGTLSFNDYGVGAIFIPSGLAYFSGPPAGSGIPAYAPLIFKVDVLSFEPDTDFDNDGIPSIMEDLDRDGDLNNDNTDSDTERVFFPNHRDNDDDGDGILTINEIELDADGNFLDFKDTDNDKIPDHLDNDN